MGTLKMCTLMTVLLISVIRSLAAPSMALQKMVDVERTTNFDDDEATGEQVFPQGVTELNDKRFTRLEDFYDKAKLLPQVQLQRLVLDFSLINEETADFDHFYHTCVEHLRRAAPNLKQLALDGGFQFYPPHPDHNTIVDELHDVKEGIQLIVRAVKSAGIQLTSVLMQVSLFIPYPLVHDSNYPQLFRAIFNKTVTDYDLERNVVECLFTVDGVPADVEFTFYNDRVFRNANKGRNPLVLNRQPREFAAQPAAAVRPRYFFTLEKFFADAYRRRYAADPHLPHVYFLLVTLVHDDAIRPDLFYRQAVQHLKDAAPGLKTLELWGGAAVHLKHGKLVELENELRSLKQNLEALLRAFRTFGVRVKKLDYEAYMNFAEDFIVSAAYPRIIQQNFGHVVTEKEVTLEIVDMEVSIFDVPCHIRLNFYFEPSIVNLRTNRMGYLHLPPWP